MVQYVVFYPWDDQEVRACITECLKAAGGSISLDRVKQKLRERLDMSIVQESILSEEDALCLTSILNMYRLEDGMVFMLPKPLDWE